MIRIARSLFLRQDDRPRRDEAREVVDVATRVVARDAAFEPENLVDPELLGEHLLRALVAELGVSRLASVEQTLFGGEQRALAVDVDRAALEDDAPLLASDARR